MKRPDLLPGLFYKDFKEYYWLKEELVLFCRKYGVSYQGNKSEVTERIALFLKGEIITNEKGDQKKVKNSKNAFNWKIEKLSLKTVISNDYRNTENVRAFFKKEIGEHFHFTGIFMTWMKQNKGKTLYDAVNEWNRLHKLKKDRDCSSEIAPQFEYNQYIRDLLRDNQNKTFQDAIQCWKIKKQQKGSRKYCRKDLNFLS